MAVYGIQRRKIMRMPTRWMLLLPIQARMILRKSKLEKKPQKKPQTGRILLVMQMKIKT